MRILNTGVVSSVPPCVAIDRPLVRKAMGNHLMNSTSLEKTQSPVSKSSMQSLSLVSATLEIEYAIPVSGFCYARNRACDAVNYQPQNGSIHLENSNDYFSTHFALTMELGHRFQSFMVIKFDC